MYLVYCGSVNVYINSLRARSLLSFCAVTIQMFAGFGLQYILDHPKRELTPKFLVLSLF